MTEDKDGSEHSQPEPGSAGNNENQISKLEALMNTIHAFGNAETTQSTAVQAAITAHNARVKARHRKPMLPGFAKDSERHRDALIAGTPLIELVIKGDQPDMFAEPEAQIRFALDEDELWETAPYAYGGPTPKGAYTPGTEIEHYESAIAWDDKHIMFPCIRGICMVTRERWLHTQCCPGC